MKKTTKFAVSKDCVHSDGDNATQQANDVDEDDDEDEFFGPQDSDHDDDVDPDVSTTTRRTKDPFGRMSDYEVQSQYQRLYTIAYVDSFDVSKESRLQNGFEHGYKQSFDVGQRIGRMFGKVSTAQSVQSQAQAQQRSKPPRASSNHDDADNGDQEELNVEETKKKNIREASMLIRDFFDTGFSSTPSTSSPPPPPLPQMSSLRKTSIVPSPQSSSSSAAVEAAVTDIETEKEGATDEQQLSTDLKQLEDKIQKTLLYYDT